MKLKLRSIGIDSREPTVILNEDDCLTMGVDVNDRVKVDFGRTMLMSVIISDDPLQKGFVSVPSNLMQRCIIGDEVYADVEYTPMPESVRCIKKKINGGSLSREEMDSIVKDIQEGALTAQEILSFVSAFNINNTDISEVADLTRSMASTGRTVGFGSEDVYDFHSLGGVPGNKITPIVVSIVASKGLLIPKLSSRAISSACGTSDYVETFCDVELDSDSLITAVSTAGGVFACGNTDYAPVGKEIIRAEKPMGIDPRPMMLASIMSKKVALGIKHLLTDIPMGKGSKIESLSEAEDYAKDIIALGKELGIRTECVITSADQPVGMTIGPVLEARECIRALETGTGDSSLIEKACSMAGILLEMSGIQDGLAEARRILKSGLAHSKFLEIVKVQGGSGKLHSDDLVPGKIVKDVHAKRDGYVQYIDNQCMVAIARGAGSPTDKGAGVEMLHKRGDYVKEGDVLFRIYAENQAKSDRATESARSRRPMYVSPAEPEGIDSEMVIRRISE